jgi:hypothetical protein
MLMSRSIAPAVLLVGPIALPFALLTPCQAGASTTC